MGNKMDANIRGADIGILENLQQACDDDQIDSVLENEKVQACITDAGLDAPTSALELTDFLAEIKNEPSDKYNDLPNKLMGVIKEEFPEI